MNYYKVSIDLCYEYPCLDIERRRIEKQTKDIGRKTAVANTSQMVDAMAEGVYAANLETNMLIRQIIEYTAEIAAKEYSGGGEVTAESITRAMARNNRRIGKTVVAVG